MSSFGNGSTNGTARRLTFSINTPENLVTGRLYKLAKRLDVPIVSLYRHNLDVYELLLKQAEDALGSGASKMMNEAVSMVSMSTVIREEGIDNKKGSQIQELLKRSGRPDLSEFVNGLMTVELALLIDRARYRVAYPDIEDDDDNEDEDTEANAV